MLDKAAIPEICKPVFYAKSGYLATRMMEAVIHIGSRRHDEAVIQIDRGGMK